MLIFAFPNSLVTLSRCGGPFSSRNSESNSTARVQVFSLSALDGGTEKIYFSRKQRVNGKREGKEWLLHGY